MDQGSAKSSDLGNGQFAATLQSGETAVTKACTVQFERDRLLIQEIDGPAEYSWPIRNVQLIDEAWHDSHGLRLRTDEIDGPRLQLADEAILPLLKEARAPLRRGLSTFWPATLATGLLATVLAFLWFGMPVVATLVAKVAPREWEENLGEQVANTAMRAFATGESGVRACVAEEGTNALAKLVARLDVYDGADYTYQVRVIEGDMVNAFAAPGGFIVFLSPILEEFENPEELAAVLAHEMAHVTHQHSLKGIVRAAGVGAMASVVTGDVTGSTFGVAIEVGLNSSNSRTAEREADITGIETLNAAGVTSTGLGTFFDRIAKEHGGEDGLMAFLSSHPASAERAGYADGFARVSQAPMTDAEWQAVKDICSETEIIDDFQWPEWVEKVRERLPAQ